MEQACEATAADRAPKYGDVLNEKLVTGKAVRTVRIISARVLVGADTVARIVDYARMAGFAAGH